MTLSESIRTKQQRRVGLRGCEHGVGQKHRHCTSLRGLLTQLTLKLCSLCCFTGGQHPEAESFPCPAVRYLSREFEGAFTPEEQLNAVSEALQAVVPTCARGTWTAFKSAIEVLPLSAALLCSAAGWLRGLRTKSREGSGLGVFAGRGVPDLSEEMLRLLAALTDLAAAEQRLVLNQHHEGSEIQLRQNTRKALIQACSKGVLPLQVTARWVQRAFSTADSSACFPADLLLRGAAVLQRATSPTCAVALAASACVLASHALRQGSSGQEHRANDAQWMEALGLLVAVSHERWVPLLQGLARHIWWGNPDTPGAAVPAATCAHAMLPSVVGYLQASSDALRKTSCRADEKAGVWASAAERSLVLPCLQAACVALGASRLRAEGKQDEFESALVADAKAAVAWWGNQAANLLELLLAQSAPDQPKHPATVAAAVWAIAASFRSRRVSPARGPRSGPKGRTSLDRALDAATARLLALCGKGHLSDGNAVKMAVCAAANVAHLSLLPHVLPGKLFSPPSHQETAGAGDASRRAAQTAAVNATCLPDSGQVEQTSSSALPGNDPGSEPVGGKTQRTRRISLKRPIKRVSSNPYVQAAFAEEIEELSSDEDLDTEDGYSDLEDFIVCDAETDYGKLLAKRRRFAAKANRAV